MTPGDRRPLRIALLLHTCASPPDSAESQQVRELASALRDAGHRPHVLSSHRRWAQRTVEDGVPVLRTMRPPDALLRVRGLAGPLTQVPLGVAALTGPSFHLAHAFSAPDALTALTWRRLTGGPALFTCIDVLERKRLADRRLRQWLLQRAVEDTDALIAANETSRAALSRWMAIDAVVIESRDAVGHERLYREVLTRRR